MKIVFFGSSNFAVPSLQALLASHHDVVCVVTQPDRKKGRGLHVAGTAVKDAALSLGLRLYQPSRINNAETLAYLKNLQPDLFVVVAYGQILPKEILEVPKIFSVNAHASLLPKYRGAAPVSWAIINGERNTGLTVIKMTPRMDAGPIILQKAVDIKVDDTALVLEQRLSDEAASLLLEALELIEQGTYKLTAQDEKAETLAPKIKKEKGLIDWNQPNTHIRNLVNGCIDWPGAFTFYQGRMLKIFKAQALLAGDKQGLPGEILNVSKNGIVVSAGSGTLCIEELQAAGKRRMKAEEFIAGHKIRAGEILGK